MKPGNFILDLLRTYGHRGTSARNIMQAASMFDFTDNAIRVTLSRLAARGLIENVTRGQYRLASGSDPVNDFVEEWRLGESRRRPWTGEFVMVHTCKASARQSWALTATGFIQPREHLWVRPDNLRREGEELVAWLAGLGICEDSVVAVGCRLSDELVAQLQAGYDTGYMQTRYNNLLQQIRKSTASLQDKPYTDALKESFTLGGKVLQILAKDPCLPEEWMASESRAALCDAMIRYDRLGRNVWSGNPDSLPADTLTASHA